MGFTRNITRSLEQWKESTIRKPLILRGARQIGKTTIVNEFGNQFDHFVYLNLERKRDKRFFENTDDVKVIYNRIILDRAIVLKENQRFLLFIDEIQEIPEVIELLRYFYEELSHIFVIAAGSLLEFALGDLSHMPVGRIQFLYMYPMNFDEFLQAQGKEAWLSAFEHIPVSTTAHTVLLEQFNRYCIIGGMPEVVNAYLNDGEMTSVTAIYQSIWQTYRTDIEKYATNSNEKRIIRHILETAPFYFDERIKFQNFGNSNYRSREVAEAFRSLDAAGLIRLLYPTTNLIPPIQKDFKKSPRIQFLDIGIVNHVRKIQADLLHLNDLSDAYKGALIPQVIYQELTSLYSLEVYKPDFWVRDKTQSSAEVDLIICHKNKLIPIEIKSGKTGSLKSLHQFINRCDHPYAIRIFGGQFSIQNQITPEGKPYKLMNLPYYLATKLHAYLDYFIRQD